MPRPRLVSDEDIDRAAREVFLAFGPSATTARVAERLGISQAAVLKRVGSKEQLLIRALCPSGPPLWATRLDAGPSRGADVRSELIAILVDACAFFAELAPRLVVLRASGIALSRVFPPGMPPPPVLVRHALGGWLARAAAAGVLHCESPAMVAEAFLGAIESRGFLRDVGGPGWVAGDDEQYVAALVDSVWLGLGPPNQS